MNLLSLLDQSYPIREYSDQSIIKLAGETCQSIGIVVEGQAVIQYINDDGQLMTISAFKKNMSFGGNRLFCKDKTYPLTIIAKGSTKVMYIPGEDVLKLCQTNEAFLLLFLEDLASKSDQLFNNIKKIKFSTIEEQIIHYLKVKVHQTNSYEFDLSISKKEWAEQLGIQRTSLSRALQKMQKKGWLSFKNHHYIIHDKTIFK